MIRSSPASRAARAGPTAVIPQSTDTTTRAPSAASPRSAASLSPYPSSTRCGTYAVARTPGSNARSIRSTIADAVIPSTS